MLALQILGAVVVVVVLVALIAIPLQRLITASFPVVSDGSWCTDRGFIALLLRGTLEALSSCHVTAGAKIDATLTVVTYTYDLP